MVQSSIVPIDVAFLTYDPKRCSDAPLVKQDNSCVVSLEELKRHRDMKRRERAVMGPEAYHHYKWYNSMLSYELKSNPEATKIKVIHWHIESGNMEAFMLNGKLYKNVSIIIGDMEHWYCANVGKDGSHSYGSRYRRQPVVEEKNPKRLAIFTVDDNEAHFIVKDENFSKCTTEFCANNCIECKKFRSPFSKNNRIFECACFPSKNEFKSITESDEEYDSDSDCEDVVQERQNLSLQRKGLFEGALFKLKAINEE